MPYIHLIAQLTKRLTHPLPGHRYHSSLKGINSNKTLPVSKEKSFLKPASVLILLFPKDHSIHFYLTKRTDKVEHHKNQISLPGGAIESGESIQDAALRETTEELGVNLDSDAIIGKLTPFNIPVSGYRVHPFIAWCDFIPKVKPDPTEVEQVLIPSLHSLLDDSNIHNEKRRYNGTNYIAPYFQFPEGKVWGATAMILSEFKYILKETK